MISVETEDGFRNKTIQLCELIRLKNCFCIAQKILINPLNLSLFSVNTDARLRDKIKLRNMKIEMPVFDEFFDHFGLLGTDFVLPGVAEFLFNGSNGRCGHCTGCKNASMCNNAFVLFDTGITPAVLRVYKLPQSPDFISPFPAEECLVDTLTEVNACANGLSESDACSNKDCNFPPAGRSSQKKRGALGKAMKAKGLKLDGAGIGSSNAHKTWANDATPGAIFLHGDRVIVTGKAITSWDFVSEHERANFIDWTFLR